jgi:hypothetical protein
LKSILATDYVDSVKDEKDNVPALLNCGHKNQNKIIVLNISAELAKYLYLSHTAVYYLKAIRYQYKEKTIGRDYYERLLDPDMYGKAQPAKKLFGVIEIYADDFPNQSLKFQ